MPSRRRLLHETTETLVSTKPIEHFEEGQVSFGSGESLGATAAAHDRRVEGIAQLGKAVLTPNRETGGILHGHFRGRTFEPDGTNRFQNGCRRLESRLRILR